MENYAQEIVENQINENIEALLCQTSDERETQEYSIKSDLNLEAAHPIFNASENLLVLRPAVIPKNAFSYTQDMVSNKPKPPPKPKIKQRMQFCETIESMNITQNSLSQSSSDLQGIGDLNDSSINQPMEESSYIKLEDTATAPPPLPNRPPPIFKYPLGMFHEDMNETGAKDSQMQKKSSQDDLCQSDQIARDSSIHNKDWKYKGRSSQERSPLSSELKSIHDSSSIPKNLKTSPNLDLKIIKDDLRNCVYENNAGNTQKKSPMASETSLKSLPTTMANLDATTHSRRSIPPKANVAAFPKRSISIPIGLHEHKPPIPLPRPDLHDYKNHQESSTSDNIPRNYPRRSISTPLEINETQKTFPHLKQNENREMCQPRERETEKFINPIERSINLEATDFKKKNLKPNIPSKPKNLFHQQLEQVLVEQRTRDHLNSKSKLSSQPLENQLAGDIVGTDISHSFVGFPTDSERPISKPENLKFENIKLDSSPITEEPSRNDSNKEQSADFSVFYSLNRPTLPQKIKPPQRPLSYTNFKQTVKTILNPSDKNRRISTGMISKITEETIKPQPSTQKTTEDNKFSEGPLEEEEKILQSAWFHDISASEAQRRLLKLDQDGAFLIRPTSRPTENKKYTASITYAGRVFNIHIRRKENYCYALGKEKEGEKSFRRLSDLIKYYQDMPFDIHPIGNPEPHAICFRVTPSH